jgi:hypothetical protein
MEFGLFVFFPKRGRDSPPWKGGTLAHPVPEARIPFLCS